MTRWAAIDVGTNSVLLLVAERGADGKWRAVHERAEITRLGKGVDRTRTLAPEAREATLAVLEGYAAEAKALGVEHLVASATSAARDATNGAEFLAEAKARAGVTLEILSGDEEARLSFASVADDPAFAGSEPCAVVDIGGGSTELVYGTAGNGGTVAWRHSFDVGSVRLTERFVKRDPPAPEERVAVTAFLRETFSAAPPPPAGVRLVGVAGTVTTLLALKLGLHPYDSSKVHGAFLSRQELVVLSNRLFAMPLSERRGLPGLQPQRADVLPQGALILAAAIERLGVEGCFVSDRGLRWGLLTDRARGR